MSKSYEERMAEKYNFLKKDKNTSSEVTNKNTEHDEQVSNDEVIDVEGQEDSLLVPLDAWNTVLNQLGNLHEASQQMAEARERAAKPKEKFDDEAQKEFLKGAKIAYETIITDFSDNDNKITNAKTSFK